MHDLVKSDRTLSPIRERVGMVLRDIGKTPLELAQLARIDKRTARRAVTGENCSLETYEALTHALGCEFALSVMGLDPIASLEAEIDRERERIASRERLVARYRAAQRARDSVDDGGLRLVAL